MKRTVFLSLGLIVLANALTFNSAQAIDWIKVKKHSITALKIAVGVAAVAGIAYGIKYMINKHDQNKNVQAEDVIGLAQIPIKADADFTYVYIGPKR